MKIFNDEELVTASIEYANRNLGDVNFANDHAMVQTISSDFLAGCHHLQNKFVDLVNYGAGLIALERISHTRRGYDAAHDDQYQDEELARAAALYAAEGTETDASLFSRWPISGYPDRRGKIERIRQLTIAGALIAAEIDILIRKQLKEQAGEQSNG